MVALAELPSATRAFAGPTPEKTRLAEGVYLFTTPPYGDVGLDGNSVVILSSDGVLVFDSNGTPAAAEVVLGEIRRMTDRPVRYVVNSHWHWDHWYGTEVYKQAFPGLQVISHEKTRALMTGPALAFNKPGLESQLPAYIRSLEERVAALEAATPAAPELPRLKRMLEDDRFFLAQKAGVRHTFANLTFAGQLDLYMGDRQVQLRHAGAAVTPGDVFLFLPEENILVAGDLLVNPVSFALSCYPTGWLRALERLDAIDASIIVPGHGAPLHDEKLLHATMDVFRALLEQGQQARARGVEVDAAREQILPGLRERMLQITRDDPAVNEAFRVQLVDWYLHRVYDELAGPLGDDIATIPRS